MAWVTAMTQAFRVFMHGLIDYAGLFPPAALDLSQALANYHTYLNDQYGWMLSNFVIPAALLDFDSTIEDIRYSVIINEDEFDTRVQQLELIAGNVKGIETRLPEKYTSSLEIADYLDKYLTHFLREGIGAIDLFVETDLVGSLLDAATSSALVGLQRQGGCRVGLKVRCGGASSIDVPSPSKIAKAIQSCRKANVPLKFTAGLHHPINHYSEELRCRQYGFINVFGAALLAEANGFTDNQIIDCLQEADSDSFCFDHQTLSWQGKQVTVSEIERLRRKLCISFGSCSFDEPLADLKNLGYLKQVEG